MLDQHSPLLSTMNIFTPCLLIYCVHSPHVWRIKKKGYIGFVSKIIFVCLYFGVRELSKKHIRQQNKNVIVYRLSSLLKSHYRVHRFLTAHSHLSSSTLIEPRASFSFEIKKVVTGHPRHREVAAEAASTASFNHPICKKRELNNLLNVFSTSEIATGLIFYILDNFCFVAIPNFPVRQRS